jgi:hypothetical protein
MAIYGNQLQFFTEQFRNFEYCSMKPNAVASYSQRTPLGTVRGVFQYMKRGELRRENDTLADVDVPTFWTKNKLVAGNFIVKDEELLRITNSADWFFEGGFYCYVLEHITGNTDKQTPHDYVDLGQNSYD